MAKADHGDIGFSSLLKCPNYNGKHEIASGFPWNSNWSFKPSSVVQTEQFYVLLCRLSLSLSAVSVVKRRLALFAVDTRIYRSYKVYSGSSECERDGSVYFLFWFQGLKVCSHESCLLELFGLQSWIDHCKKGESEKNWQFPRIYASIQRKRGWLT